jgi:hypothetical protein
MNGDEAPRNKNPTPFRGGSVKHVGFIDWKDLLGEIRVVQFNLSYSYPAIIRAFGSVGLSA